jgi:hypothetical protein
MFRDCEFDQNSKHRERRLYSYTEPKKQEVGLEYVTEFRIKYSLLTYPT